MYFKLTVNDRQPPFEFFGNFTKEAMLAIETENVDNRKSSAKKVSPSDATCELLYKYDL